MDIIRALSKHYTTFDLTSLALSGIDYKKRISEVQCTPKNILRPVPENGGILWLALPRARKTKHHAQCENHVRSIANATSQVLYLSLLQAPEIYFLRPSGVSASA